MSIEVKKAPLWRRLLPWIIAGGLIAFVASRFPLDQLKEQLALVDAPLFAVSMFGLTLSNFLADTFASLRVYRYVAPALGFRELLIFRGAAYLPAAFNFHAGQAWMAYLVRKRMPTEDAERSAVRVAGAALVSYATFMGGIVALAALSVLASQSFDGWPAKTLLPLTLAGVGYLGVLQLRPRFLAEREFLRPLFEAGPIGHISLMAARLPHLLTLLFGLYVIYAFFGVETPPSQVPVVMSAILLVSAIPITPQGLGTRELAAVSLLGPWAGEGGDAAIVAAGGASAAMTILLQLTLGLAFTPAANRRIAELEAETPESS